MLRSYTRIGLYARNIASPSGTLCSGLQTISPLRVCSQSLINHLHSRTVTSTSSPATNSENLSWDEFLRLRRQRRFTGTIASIPTAFLGIYGGLQYFGQGEIDPNTTILGFDPFFMNAAFVLGCGVLGWLMGPTVGRGIWHLLHRRKAHLIQEV